MKTHVSNVLSKLHLADRTQAAIYGLQKRPVPLDTARRNRSRRPLGDLGIDRFLRCGC